MKIYQGIIVRPHLIHLRLIALPKVQCAEKKEGASAVLWMKNGGPIFWNAIVICEVFKTSWHTPYETRFGEAFKKANSTFLEQWLKNHPISPKDQARIHQFGKNVLPGIFVGYELIAV